MTSVHVIGSHSFGKIVNKRHFVRRYQLDFIKKSKRLTTRFCSSSCRLHTFGPFTFFLFFWGGGGGGGREETERRDYHKSISTQ